jgi:hypothetical protein
MAARKCPRCLATITAGQVVAFSDLVECHGCHAELQVSPLSRAIAAWIGLACGALAWYFTRSAPAPANLEWVLPAVYAVIAFGVVSPLVLMFIADLQVRPVEEERRIAHAAPEAAHGHSAAHH